MLLEVLLKILGLLKLLLDVLDLLHLDQFLTEFYLINDVLDADGVVVRSAKPRVRYALRGSSGVALIE